MSLTTPATAAALEAPQPGADPALEEYRSLFVGLARQALAHPRLATPMPCMPHWMAGADHIVVAVSAPGAVAGLRPGDTIARIEETTVGGRGGMPWDTALHRLARDVPSYAVDVARNGAELQLTLPCSAARAARLHRAERSMWDAASRRSWRSCVEHGREMLDAFGATFSPPLLVMTRCAAADEDHDPALTHELGLALLDEMTAHPAPSPDQREQVLLLLRELDAVHRAGGADYATPLRERLTDLGIR